MLICFDTRIEGNTKFSEHFKAKEFACKDKTPIAFIDTHLIDLLEAIRNYYNSPVIINSAYRTYTWNEKVGGTEHSYHMKGMAADIRVRGVPCKNVALKASELLGKTGGVICYTNFVHVDIRTTERYRKGVL